MIYSIQTLRFFAALFVVLTHSMEALGWPFAIGGFGVDLFFIVSGFIISFVTEKSSKGFARKRIIRIVPLYWLFTILLTLITVFAPYLLKSAQFDLPHIIASLFFFPLWTEQTAFHPILKLGWTLNCEVFFYIMFFIALQISHKYREILASIFIVCAVLGIQQADLQPTNAFNFYTNTILFEFIFGMVLSRMYLSGHFSNVKMSAPVAWGCIGLGFAFMIATSIHDTGVPKYLRWGLPSALVLYASWAIDRWYDKPVRRFFTKISRPENETWFHGSRVT